MGVIGGLVEEEIVDDHAFHGLQPGGDMLRIGIGLQNVLALDVEALEDPIDGGVEHVGDAQARLGVDRRAPQFLEHLARRGVGDVAVAGHFMREAAHVAAALDIVLAA